MRNYKEIAKENRFVANVAEIESIAIENDVTVGVALDMYVTKHGINRAECNDEYQDFVTYSRELSYKIGIIADALV